MAVEARHLNPFPTQLINRNPMNCDVLQANILFPSHHTELSQIQFVGDNKTDNNPFAAATSFLPEQNQLFSSYNPTDVIYCGDSSLQEATKTSMKADRSGLSYYINSRKRSREETLSVDKEEDACYYDNSVAAAVDLPPTPYNNNPSSVLGDLDLLPQIQQQHQFDIDSLISQYTKKIRLELEERQKQRARLLFSHLGGGAAVARRLREKEAQILKMGKMNQALQEKVKSLYIENQLWRDLAQTNEATANSLRSNLEQVLSSLRREEATPAGAEDDDPASSCCGSTGGGEVVRPCRMCGGGESCVMALPCRHLCLCGGCGGGSPAVTACPVCDCVMNATLHVNMASSS